MAASSTERMEDKSERVMSPEEETGLQDKSELCVNTAHYATLPDNIVTGVTTQLPQLLSLQQHDQKVIIM